MSKQLTVSSAVSVMVMAAFVLYASGPSLNPGALPAGPLPLLHWDGFKALLAL